MENGVYGDLIIVYPEPYSIFLRGAIGFGAEDLHGWLSLLRSLLGFPNRTGNRVNRCYLNPENMDK